MSAVDARVRLGIAIAGLALAAAAVLVVTGWPGRLYRDSDWMQYYAGSRALVEGASPYDHAWWQSFHDRVGSQALSAPPRSGDLAKDWTTPYPLPAFVALIPFALLPLEIAQPLFATAQVTLLLGATIALSALTVARPRRETPMALAILIASQPFVVLVAGGNITGFAAAAFTFSLAALLTGRPLLAGVLLAGCVLKPHLFVVGAIALVLGAPRDARARLLAGAVAGALVLIVPAFALQPGWVGEWLREAGRLQSTSASNATGWTIARPFVGDFRAPSAIVVGIALGGFVAWWWRTRPGLALLVAAAMPASVLVAPHGWSYDYIALLPSATVGIGAASAASRRIIALPIVALLAVAAPWILYVIAFRRNGEDLTAWLLVAALAAYVLVRTQTAAASSAIASGGTRPEPVS